MSQDQRPQPTKQAPRVQAFASHQQWLAQKAHAEGISLEEARAHYLQGLARQFALKCRGRQSK